MRAVVVNEKDEVIGSKERSDLDAGDICRVSGVWIFNDKGEVLIAQRALSKKYDPGKWAVSAAGTVEEGESYAQNAVKEVEEELGVSIPEQSLIPGMHGFVETSHKYFYQAFFAKYDAPLSAFTFAENEVAAIKWISQDELTTWFSEKPEDFIASFKRSFDDLMNFAA